MRTFTPEEDERLLYLRINVHPGCDQGDYLRTRRTGLAAIARELGRAKSRVQVRLQILAAAEEGGVLRPPGRPRKADAPRVRHAAI